MADKKLLKNGVLIAIEGIDGAGKTTQASLLYEKLKNSGYSAVLLHEPTRSQWGEKIRDLAKNGRHKVTLEEELDLFYKDRIEDVQKNINPKLQEKYIVVMDRYYFSNVVYQGVGGLSPDYIETINEKIAPPPKLAIILDISPSEAIKRIIASRTDGPNHFEKENYLEKVRELFLKQFSGRNNVKIIDGDGLHSQQEVSEAVWSFVAPIVRQAEET
jgi:dTMP kinase